MIAIVTFEGAGMAAIIYGAADGLQQPDSFELTRVSLAPMMQPNAPFQPLDPDIVSTSIPAFFIGRNKAGFWVARDARHLVGGLFVFKRSAVEFSERESLPSRCALIFPSKPFELDVENRGNPLVGYLARWIAKARNGAHIARR